MLERIVIKITGAAGLGIKTSGLIIAKALKRAGFYTFGYTEYPSLIRGGHNIFQIDVESHEFASVSNKLNVLLALDQNSIKLHALEIEEKGVLIYDEGVCSIDDQTRVELDSKKVEVFNIDLLSVAQSVGGTGIMKNTITLGALWSVLDQDLEILNKIIKEIFGHKSQEIIDLNLKCLRAGYDLLEKKEEHFNLTADKASGSRDKMIISGNEAIGLGAIACGVRLYSSYPMTPASSILGFLAVEGTKKGMIVKQAEDEITAANMVIGASYAGTRAMCGTSGGGFDLMTEAVSLAGMTETPFVVALAQRPGPATGAPTWTAQGDLNLALYGGHGEFPRIVMAAGDTEECFSLTAEAHNLAEKYQTPVILLTDKYLAESFFETAPLSETMINIDRGSLIKPTNEADDIKRMRYEVIGNGVSPRWLPGDKINTFLANSDEHTPKGYSTEEGEEIANMIAKRTNKTFTIHDELPDPEIFGSSIEESSMLIISWGSNKRVIIDAQKALLKEGIKTAFLHVKYIWPLREGFIGEASRKAKKVIVVEGNKAGQLADLLEQKTGLSYENRILKYDGRPFFYEELINSLKGYIE